VTAFPCGHCGRAFDSEDERDAHVEREHQREIGDIFDGDDL
jgi:hypothetical protein